MTRWHWWIGLVIVWTLALEFPVPDPGDIPKHEFVLTMKFVVGKSLHFITYATLAVMSAGLPIATRFRWLMMFFLMFHAWGTEMLQELLNAWCKRGGSLSDVGIDIAGISIGTALTWKRWTS